jgi:O-methyltransferase
MRNQRREARNGRIVGSSQEIEGVTTINDFRQEYLELLKQTLTASIYPESGGRIIEDHIEPRLRHPLRLLKSLAYRWVVRSCRRRSIILIKQHAFDQQRRDLGLDWPLFGYTMVGHKRLDNIQHCVEQVLANDIPGDFAETGVWRGGSIILMRALLKVHGAMDRIVWAADSFQGMPAPASPTDGLDLRSLDYLRVSLPEVRQNIARFGLLDEQVRFIPGWFSESLPQAPIERLALLRLDGDLYSSTMDALSNLYVKMSPGGYVIIDDYHSWEPCRRAVTEFLAASGTVANLREIDGSAVYWQVGAR